MAALAEQENSCHFRHLGALRGGDLWSPLQTRYRLQCSESFLLADWAVAALQMTAEHMKVPVHFAMTWSHRAIAGLAASVGVLEDSETGEPQAVPVKNPTDRTAHLPQNYCDRSLTALRIERRSRPHTGCTYSVERQAQEPASSGRAAAIGGMFDPSRCSMLSRHWRHVSSPRSLGRLLPSLWSALCAASLFVRRRCLTKSKCCCPEEEGLHRHIGKPGLLNYPT